MSTNLEEPKNKCHMTGEKKKKAAEVEKKTRDGLFGVSLPLKLAGAAGNLCPPPSRSALTLTWQNKEH